MWNEADLQLVDLFIVASVLSFLDSWGFLFLNFIKRKKHYERNEFYY